MSSLNKCQFIGNLGKDPEVRVIGQDTKVATFSLACSESYTNRAGEKVETTEWINIVIWGKLADVVEKYVHKGDKLYVCGKLMNRSYESQDGTKKYITEIKADELIMLTPRTQGGQQSSNQSASQSPSEYFKPKTNEPQRITAPDENPDDLPF